VPAPTREGINRMANIAPAVTAADTTVAGSEDTDLVFSAANGNAITIEDADSASVTITLAAASGRLTLSQTAGLTFLLGDGSDDATIVFQGSPANVNAALEGMTYRGNLNYQGTDAVQVTVVDGTYHTDNLVVNGGAEDGPSASDFTTTVTPQGWTSEGAGFGTAVDYAAGAADDLNTADGFAVGGGDSYFSGGPSNGLPSTLSQIVDISSHAAAIDAGLIIATVSAFLGGWREQDDNAIVVADFRDAGGNSVGSVQIGPSLSDARGDVSTLLGYGSTFGVSAGARSVAISLVFSDDPATSGTYLDGYADNISLRLQQFDTQTVTITLADDGKIHGDGGDNVLAGTAGNDFFDLSQGGDDSADGSTGSDIFYYGTAFTLADETIGGAGEKDVVILQGGYTLTFDAQSLVGIEYLSLQSGAVTKFGQSGTNSYDYSIVMDEANAVPGEQFKVNGQSLQVGEDLFFDGSAETDGGRFLVYAGHGTDTLIGGDGFDLFHFEGPRFNAADTVDGGAGQDAVVISMGDGVNHIEFGENQFTSIEAISVNSRYASGPTQSPSYELVLKNGNVTAGGSLIVNGNSLVVGQTIDVDGSLVAGGSLELYGGADNDVLIGGAQGDMLRGGAGADTLTGGAGDDVFRYDAATDSTPAGRDGIQDFTAGDLIDLRLIDADTTTAGDQDFTAIGNAAFGNVAGELRYDVLAGPIWLVQGDVDGDGDADFEVAVVVTDGDPLTNADFLGTTSTSGSVVDGYIANGRVFRDTDNDGTWDVGEEFTFTDAQGNFSNLGGAGRIVLVPVYDIGGNPLTFDISTGKPFTGTLSAPAGSTVVTPLTTLVDAIAGDGADEGAIAAAQAQVLTALGLDAGLDLASYDPLAVIGAGGSPAEIEQALQVQKAAVTVANVIAVVASALEAGGVVGAEASQFASAAIAGQLAGSAGQLDLADSATLTQVVDGAATSSGAALGGQTGPIAESLAAVNAVIAQADAAGDALGTLAAIVTAQIVAQEQLAQATQAAVAGGDPLDSDDFSGNELTDRLDDAADEVEVIIPVETPPGAPGEPGRPTVDDGTRVNSVEIADGVVVSVDYTDAAGIAAGDTLRLLVGGLEVASYVLAAGDLPASGATLTHQFAVSAATLGADGTKVVTAQFVRQGGEAGAVSLPLVVTVDTAADRPNQLAAVEGPILTVVEAADGTDIVGKAETGSTVTLTFSNGANSVVKQAVAGADGFTIHLDASELGQLGHGYVSYSAVAADVAGNPAGAPVTGQFYFTAEPSFTEGRIDPPAFAAEIDDDDDAQRFDALRNGSFTLSWVVDEDLEGEHEGGIAIQKFAADGSLAGSPFLLQGLPGSVSEGDDLAADFTALEGGGFAFAYGTRPSLVDGQFSAVGNATGTLNFTVVGRPVSIYVIDAPAGATFTLSGRNAANTGPENLVLTPVGGLITITEDMLDGFLFDFRFNLVVGGVGAGVPVNLGIDRAVEKWVDLDAPLVDQTTTMTVTAGFGIASGLGRVESFDVLDATPASGSVAYQLLIAPMFGPLSVYLGDIPNATAAANGSIVVTGIAPDANGVVTVPEAILERLGTQDAQISLLATNLLNGSTFSAVGTARPLEDQLDGLYVQVFDENGVATTGPVQIDTALRANVSDDDGAPTGITPLADGGFLVHWVTDTDIDGDGDGLAVQRFDASGAAVDAPVVLQDISDIALNSEELVFDLAPLDGGGYALGFGVEHESAFRGVGANLLANGSAFFPIIGKVEDIFIGTAPVGATFTLVGRNAANTGTANVPLTVVDGRIEVDESVFANFLLPNRLSLQVTGPNGGIVDLGISAEVDQAVDLDAALQPFAYSGTAALNRVTINMGGRIESVDIETATPTGAAPLYQLVVVPVFGAYSVDLTGIPNASIVGTGQIVINNLTADANGVVQVPALLLERLGDQDVGMSLNVSGLVNGSTVTASAQFRPFEAVAEGVFVQLFDANGAAVTAGDVRIDAANPADIDDDAPISVTPLADGGFAVHWLVDEDDADGIVVQRFDAAGTVVGSPITLQGIPQELLDADEPVIDFTVRPDGGFLLSYGLEHDDAYNTVSATGNGSPLAPFSIAGQPSSIYIQSAPAGATFVLRGPGSTFDTTVEVALTPTNGFIEITEDILGQFGDFGRFGLFVDGVAVGETVTLGIETDVTRAVDLAAPLEAFASSSIVGADGIVAITGPGRVEAFDVSQATPEGSTPSYILLVTPTHGAMSVDLTGMAGVFASPSGSIVVTGLAPNAEGVLAVPQLLLDRLGDQDANVFLIVQGVEPGFASSATAYGRPTTLMPEGLFVRAFDADGNPVGADLNLIGTAGDDILTGDVGNDQIAGLGGDNVLTGGAGHDLFRFSGALGDNLITDFDTGVDMIDLSALDADGAAADDQAFSFIGSAAFSGTAGELRAEFDGTANVWRVEGDTDGVGGADFVIEVAGSLADPLVAADFVL